MLALQILLTWTENPVGEAIVWYLPNTPTALLFEPPAGWFLMSAFGGKADMRRRSLNVCF